MKEVEKLQEKREKRRLQQQELREKRAQVCNENIFCLRYALDEHNFHYICYEVEFDRTTDCDLIDNINEA